MKKSLAPFMNLEKKTAMAIMIVRYTMMETQSMGAMPMRTPIILGWEMSVTTSVKRKT